MSSYTCAILCFLLQWVKSLRLHVDSYLKLSSVVEFKPDALSLDFISSALDVRKLSSCSTLINIKLKTS